MELMLLTRCARKAFLSNQHREDRTFPKETRHKNISEKKPTFHGEYFNAFEEQTVWAFILFLLPYRVTFDGKLSYGTAATTGSEIVNRRHR